jgi:glycosyltransferase A (GT-A) superfamily protein (DUF2064 family)
MDQGGGNLGDRLDRLWRLLGSSGPVAFFGSDSPDVPEEVLGQLPEALGRAELAVGRTPDGGYWTIAGQAPHPEVLVEIDWGGPAVYDQTLQRAAEAGLSVHELPPWFDVDHPADLAALRCRLRETVSSAAAGEHLPALARQLDATTGDAATRWMSTDDRDLRQEPG